MRQWQLFFRRKSNSMSSGYESVVYNYVPHAIVYSVTTVFYLISLGTCLRTLDGTGLISLLLKQQ